MRLIELSDDDLILLTGTLRIARAAFIGSLIDLDALLEVNPEVGNARMAAGADLDGLQELADAFAGVLADPDDGRIHLCS